MSIFHFTGDSNQDFFQIQFVVFQPFATTLLAQMLRFALFWSTWAKWSHFRAFGIMLYFTHCTVGGWCYKCIEVRHLAAGTVQFAPQLHQCVCVCVCMCSWATCSDWKRFAQKTHIFLMSLWKRQSLSILLKPVWKWRHTFIHELWGHRKTEW